MGIRLRFILNSEIDFNQLKKKENFFVQSKDFNFKMLWMATAFMSEGADLFL